jgi:hypothetical protein
MLVSVLVDRYQRVYKRKRFLNEDYSENMTFNNSSICLHNNDECIESPRDIEKESNNISECINQNEEKQDNDERSGKVRFRIGCVSDDDEDLLRMLLKN